MTKRDLLKGMGAAVITTIPVAKVAAQSIHCEAELLTQEDLEEGLDYEDLNGYYVDVEDSCWASIGILSLPSYLR